MHAGVAHIAFEHLGIADGVAQHGVGRSLRFLQLGNAGDGIRQIHLALLAVFIVGQFIGDEFTQCVRSVERQFLHARHILDGQFRGHGTVSNDVRHLLLTVFLSHPAQHLSASVVIEVHINIGQGDTVGVQETLEQQVIFNRVDLCDTETVGHRRTGSRTTARAY